MWLLLACNGDGDSPIHRESLPVDDTALVETGEPPERFVGEGGGYGHALASDGDRVFVSAPWIGSVYELDGTLHTLGPVGSGYAMAYDDDLLMGNPLEGTLSDGTEGEYGAVVRRDGGWLLSRGLGAEFPSGPVALPERPADLALWNGQRVAGMAHGTHALSIEEELVERLEPGDGAGYALCVADVDSDGVDELVVGAPNAGVVYLVEDELETAESVVGEGRFGHSLACAEGLLVVGAPMSGAELAGEVVIYEDLDPVAVVEGEVGDTLGASVLLSGDRIFAGAPGSTEGAVLRLR
ncbi:MAG TPA: FG-GAP repeat protein [Myxococcota bacterium]|nr:FG-GAP repeat protein [Myxococcota bacterium]